MGEFRWRQDVADQATGRCRSERILVTRRRETRNAHCGWVDSHNELDPFKGAHTARMFGGVVTLETPGEAPGFLWSEGQIERGVFVGVEVVLDQDDLFRIGEKLGSNELQGMGVVDLGAAGRVGYEDLPTAFDRRVGHEGGGTTLAPVFVIVARGPAWTGRLREAFLAQQLLAELVEADQRALRVEWPVIDFEHISHRGDEVRVAFGRDAPALLQPRFNLIFFNLVRTASWEIESTTSSSTSLSASRCSVQRRHPSGASEQARAVSLASTSPVIFETRDGLSCLLRSRAARGPTSQTRVRSLVSVAGLIPVAPMISGSVHAGPPSDSSANRMERALITLWAAIDFALSKLLSCSRSPELSLIR